MEVFSSEVRMRTSDHFPDNISPFPSSSSSFDSLLAACEGEATGVSTPLPPQKLRPIRCNAFVYHNNKNTTTEEAFMFQASAEFGGQSSLVEAVGLGELGFVSDIRVVEGGAQAFRVAEVDMEIKRLNHLVDSRTSSSSESEVSGDLLENAQGSDNRKRRRRRERGKKLQGFMEAVVSQVLLKQEMMHNKLMEMLERKERERLMREEAWKQQEMERMRREEQVRAQETARNVALIEFIQNIMGKDFQMGQPFQKDNLSKDEAELYKQRDD